MAARIPPVFAAIVPRFKMRIGQDPAAMPAYPGGTIGMIDGHVSETHDFFAHAGVSRGYRCRSGAHAMGRTHPWDVHHSPVQHDSKPEIQITGVPKLGIAHSDDIKGSAANHHSRPNRDIE